MVRLNIVQLTKRVPLIQFRKGGSALTNKPAASQQASSKDSGAKKVNYVAH